MTAIRSGAIPSAASRSPPGRGVHDQPVGGGERQRGSPGPGAAWLGLPLNGVVSCTVTTTGPRRRRRRRTTRVGERERQPLEVQQPLGDAAEREAVAQVLGRLQRGAERPEPARAPASKRR